MNTSPFGIPMRKGIFEKGSAAVLRYSHLPYPLGPTLPSFLQPYAPTSGMLTHHHSPDVPAYDKSTHSTPAHVSHAAARWRKRRDARGGWGGLGDNGISVRGVSLKRKSSSLVHAQVPPASRIEMPFVFRLIRSSTTPSLLSVDSVCGIFSGPLRRWLSGAMISTI